MRRMIVAACVLASLVTGASADSREYIDQANGFRVTVPANWEAKATSKDEIKLILVSKRFDTTEGLCAIATDTVEGSRSMSQQEINDKTASQFDEAFWRDVLTDEQTSSVVIEEVASELRNGRRVHRARARAIDKTDGGEQPVQYRMGMHLIPGRIIMLQCSVKLEHVQAEDQALTIVANTLEPDTSGVVALSPMPRAAARLVVFSGPRFDGRRRDLTQASANLAQTGWTVPVASSSVRGFGLWQVCSGPNFSGVCTTLSGAASAAHGDQPLSILSARPVSAPGDIRSSTGVVADLAVRLKQRRP